MSLFTHNVEKSEILCLTFLFRQIILWQKNSLNLTEFLRYDCGSQYDGKVEKSRLGRVGKNQL